MAQIPAYGEAITGTPTTFTTAGWAGVFIGALGLRKGNRDFRYCIAPTWQIRQTEQRATHQPDRRSADRGAQFLEGHLSELLPHRRRWWRARGRRPRSPYMDSDDLPTADSVSAQACYLWFGAHGLAGKRVLPWRERWELHGVVGHRRWRRQCDDVVHNCIRVMGLCAQVVQDTAMADAARLELLRQALHVADIVEPAIGVACRRRIPLSMQSSLQPLVQSR